MERFRPLLRAGILAVPVLTAGCAGGGLPAPAVTDTSCMLLCALQRQFFGEPARIAVPIPATPAVVPVLPAPRRVARQGAAAHRVKIAPAAHALSPKPRRPAANVSVEPRASPRSVQLKPALVPSPGGATPPVMTGSSAAPQPVAPPTSLSTGGFSRTIPGSASIVLPGWQSP